MKQLIVLAMLSALWVSPVAANPGKDHGLPPGLQKKVERGESLPPGWQRKLDRGDRLPEHYERYGDVHHESDRYDRVRIEDDVFRVIRNTGEIIDILNSH